MFLNSSVSAPIRTAVIDLGSNSARVIIMNSVAGYSYHLEDEIREIVRLREGMTELGLSEAAMARGIAVLRLFKQFCDSLEVDHIIATATSAVREAANGEQFLKRVKEQTGLSLKILAGDQEAFYGVIGALGAVGLQNGVVVDIGGGSAQVSRIVNHRFYEGQALTLGALALTERFVHSDPITKLELKATEDEIERQLDSVDWLSNERGPIVGLGGTIRTLAKIAAARDKFPLQSINGYQLSLSNLEETIKQFCELPLQQRRRIPGMVRDRADIILSGALVIRAITKRLNQDKLTISENGLREGLFFNEFWSDQPYPVIENLREFSVLNLARFYDFHQSHAAHVVKLSTSLFDQLQPLHGYGTVEREWLSAASILHDIGTIIRYNDHHKHSQTLIINNGLAGYSQREVAIIALLTRYHRKGNPSTSEFSSLLKDGDSIRLRQLAAILRLSEYLERGRSGIVQNIKASWTKKEIILDLVASKTPVVEMWVAQRSGIDLMESAFERRVILQSA
jgi:exopolyphosphatase/guanosine-5'-triphosphate,3'-diphosphate pyrophosphatase